MSEVKELKYDELPEYLQNEVDERISEDINDTGEFLIEEKFEEFNNKLEKKYKTSIDLEKIEYDFSDRCPYIKIPSKYFQYFLAEAIDSKLTENQRDYFMGVQVYTKSVGVGQFEFPVYEVGYTEDNAINVEISGGCPNRTEQAIRNKASKVFYDFMEDFKQLFYDLRKICTSIESDIYKSYTDSVYKVKDNEIIEIKDSDGKIVYESSDMSV